jgi:hypothetical protein
VFFLGFGAAYSKNKKERTHQWMGTFRLSCASLFPLFIAPPTNGKR